MIQTVRFHRIGGPEVLNVEETSIPTPGPNEVVVKVHAAGLNRAELLFMQGQYIVQPGFPSAIGLEASGIVHTVGQEVTKVRNNDAVCLIPNVMPTDYGFIGEYVLVPEEAILPKPDNLSFQEAAAFWMAFGSAYAGLILRGGLQQGTDKTVLITAASSSVGIAAIQMAKHLGARVIATSRTLDKKDFLIAQGADHVVATLEGNPVDAIKEATGGRGFDLALDPIAGSMVAPLADAAAPEAKIVIYGVLSPEQAVLPLFPMLLKGISLTGFHLVFHVLQHPERIKAMQNFLLDGLRSANYKPVIDRVFSSLEQTREAYAYMASNQQKGKIILEV